MVDCKASRPSGGVTEPSQPDLPPLDPTPSEPLPPDLIRIRFRPEFWSGSDPKSAFSGPNRVKISQESPQQTKPKKGPKRKVHEFRPFLWILVFFLGKTSTIHIELLFRTAPAKSSWTDLSLVWFAGATPESGHKIGSGGRGSEGVGSKGVGPAGKALQLLRRVLNPSQTITQALSNAFFWRSYQHKLDCWNHQDLDGSSAPQVNIKCRRRSLCHRSSRISVHTPAPQLVSQEKGREVGSNKNRGFAKGWFPKGWFRRMFPRNENRNEGTFAKTTLLRNRPFISQWKKLSTVWPKRFQLWCFSARTWHRMRHSRLELRQKRPC